MSKLHEMFLEIESLFLNEKIRVFFWEIIKEIEALKTAPSMTVMPELEKEEWLMPDEFVKKYPLFHADQLGTLRVNCPDPNQKFYKAVAYEYAYNPRETFRYIMRLPIGKVKTKNRLIRNNYFGVNVADEF